MNQDKVILRIKKYLKDYFKDEATGHDWWHSERVWKLSKEIAKKEGGNLFIVELAALLHDVDDWKFNKNNLNKVKSLLNRLKVNKDIIDKVCYIIDNISFKAAGLKDNIKTKEGKIVQDADRLDAIGAIGIARVFAYGGFINRSIYNPNIKPKLYKSFNAYKYAKSSSINHFYEKVLLLKNRLNTKTAKKIAENRHEFVKNYLKQFLKEWNGL